ncbi:MAG: response regulator [Proteobacteria bacterium]|nr:response regulator [Pseudomonadota bacterium]
MVSVSDGLSLVLFICISGAFCLAIHALQTAVQRLRVAREHEREFAQILERRIAERTTDLVLKTQELDDANKQLQAEIAERARAEAALRQAQKLEAVGQLTGGIAHDFNNLLTIIQGNLELALRRLSGREPDIANLISNAMQGAQQGCTLTHRLLAFSRQQALAPAPLDLNAVVKSMSDMIRRTLGEAIEVEVVVAAGLWRTFCDPHELEAALLNVVLNARDAMPSGGKLTVETANVYIDEDYARHHVEVTPGQYVLLAVTDTGIGMDDETSQRIFEPFFTTKEVGRGTGLGLSMVFGFVKQSRGHIKVYSEIGQGTCFKIYLPRLTDDVQQATISPAPQTAPLPGGAHTILVVEDNTEVRAFIVQVLREIGYLVYEAADAPSAQRLLAAEPAVDLLLTDVGLPGMNGRMLADAAAQDRPHLRVLYITGYTRNAIVHGGRLDPGVALLPKPFTSRDLAEKVRAALDGVGH